MWRVLSITRQVLHLKGHSVVLPPIHHTQSPRLSAFLGARVTLNAFPISPFQSLYFYSQAWNQWETFNIETLFHHPTPPANHSIRSPHITAPHGPCRSKNCIGILNSRNCLDCINSCGSHMVSCSHGLRVALISILSCLEFAFIVSLLFISLRRSMSWPSFGCLDLKSRN